MRRKTIHAAVSKILENKFTTQEKPTCAVNGMIQHGAMCGAVIVNGNRCGHNGQCEHQRTAEQAGKGEA